jgi:NADH-quinone oxidoreductase subunit G
MATVYVNNQEVHLGDSERLNVIQAAQRVGVEVPHYCWHPSLSVVASCRMCLVQYGDKKPDGSIAMQPKLVPGCQTPVKDGSVIITDSPVVEAAQKATLEYLLLNHPLDCPTCDQAGECFLQDYSYNYGRSYSRLQEPKLLKPDKDYIGDQITLFTDRCVMCSRCVRFTREISGTAELQIIDRGSHSEIDIFPGEPCNNKLAGNVVDICPVGALCSKDFLYKQRVWWLEGKEGVCPNCSTGCSIRVDQNDDTVYRLKPRFNPKSQGHFMCDEGRFGFKYIHSPDRLTRAESRRHGQTLSLGWKSVLPTVRQALKEAVSRKAKGVAAILSPWLTVEEAYLLAGYLKSLSPEVLLAMGPVQVVGEDDHYPKTIQGAPVSPPKFIIRAEKCPNRVGVEEVLKHFQGEVISQDQVFDRIGKGEIDSLYLAGGDPFVVWSSDHMAALEKLSLLIVEDILETDASRKAHYVLPGGSFAEKDGTFINHAGLAQAIRRSIHGPGDAKPDGRILWELAGRVGLFHAGNLRREIGDAIPALKALRRGDLGEHGTFLTESEEAASTDGNGKPEGTISGKREIVQNPTIHSPQG